MDAEHVGDPNQAIIFRQAGACLEYERLANPPGPDQESGFRATALAVDGDDALPRRPRHRDRHPRLHAAARLLGGLGRLTPHG